MPVLCPVGRVWPKNKWYCEKRSCGLKHDKVLLETVFNDPVVETIYHRDRFSCVQRAQGIFHVVDMTSWKAGSTLPLSGGSVTLGSCTVIMWFISLLTVLAHNNDLVHQIWQVTQIGLIIWVDRLLMMGYWHDMVLWLGVNTYTSMCWSSKLNESPEKSHFTFPSFAPSTRLCPPKAYIGMI